MLSTSDLAKRFNCSRQAVLKHYKQNKRKIGSHSFKRKNKRMFDKTAISIITKSFKPNYQNSNQNDNVNDNVNLQVYNTLKEQLDRKDQQIRDLNQNINNLNRELSQAQLMELEDRRELNQSQNQLKLVDKRQKHGWIWRLFH